MTMYWCPLGVLGVTEQTLINEYVGNNPTRQGREARPGHLYAYFQRHACSRFKIQPVILPDQIVDRGGWFQEEAPRVEPEHTPAICETHLIPAQRVQHEMFPMMTAFAQITGYWNCYPCGRLFEGNDAFVAHLNQAQGCATWLIGQARGIPENFPAAINWPEANGLIGFEIEEDQEDEDEDDDREPWEPDDEPIEPRGRITFEIHDEQVTIVNHFDDTARAPVTTNDGRYLRWNTLNQQYEEARRPATTLHDLFGGHG